MDSAKEQAAPDSADPERRESLAGVAQHVDLSELHGYILQGIREARVDGQQADAGPHPQDEAFYNGKIAALVDVLAHAKRIAVNLSGDEGV